MPSTDKEQQVKLCRELEAEIKIVIEDVLDIQLPEGEEWICAETMVEVVIAAKAAIEDKRNQYPFNLSALKYISVFTAWLIKLKPINSVNLIDRSSKNTLLYPHINEAVAIAWAIIQLRRAIVQGKLLELIRPSEENLANFDLMHSYYYRRGFYRSIEPPHEEKLESRKINETINNLRFKRTSSILIYEILSHLILPFKMKREVFSDA